MHFTVKFSLTSVGFLKSIKVFRRRKLWNSFSIFYRNGNDNRIWETINYPWMSRSYPSFSCAMSIWYLFRRSHGWMHFYQDFETKKSNGYNYIFWQCLLCSGTEFLFIWKNKKKLQIIELWKNRVEARRKIFVNVPRWQSSQLTHCPV